MNFKRLITTSLVGSIGLAALSLSLSFAWYSTSENLYIDTLVINVSGSRELRISTINDVSGMTDSLKYHFEDETSELPGVSPFKPVSTMFSSSWIDQKASDPVFYEYEASLVDSLYAPRHVTSKWGFYSQHLYLRCNADTSVTLDASLDNLYIAPIRRLNEKRARELIGTEDIQKKYANEHPEYTEDEIFEDIITKLNNLTNCMRIAILDPDESSYKFTIIDPYKEEPTLLGGREDLFLTRYYDSYINSDNKELYETIYGEVNDRSLAVYGEKSPTDSEPPKEYTSFDAMTKADVHPFDYEKSVENGLVIKEEESLARSEIESKFTLELKAGVIKEFVLAIYMEGWDRDCINSHMGGSFDMKLNFKIAENEQQ